MLLIGALAGIFARRAIAPLREFSASVSTLSVNQLGRRVDVAGAPVELRDFAGAFNRLLANLDDAFNRLRAFSSDIAHELRGPLANLVGRTQLALSRSRSAAEYRHALESNAEELERLTRMVGDMLFLAQVENAASAVRGEPVDLGRLAHEVAEFYQIAADERGIRIEVTGAARIHADPLLVRRALGNLLSNSISHTPRGQAIRVAIGQASEDRAGIAVSNPGPGIPRELQERIFDRFVRGDANRHSTDAIAGTGLGLAIVRSIMTVHGGAVAVESRPQGPTTFSLQFPKAERAS
jgi:two-component system heavy metal sensor histidine kinase CusS